jgi:hypothetical protein
MRFPHVSSKTAVTTGPSCTGSCANFTPSPCRRSTSAETSATAKEAAGIPSATSASLKGRTAGWLSGSSNSSGPRALVVTPPSASGRPRAGPRSSFQNRGSRVETQGLVLVIHEHIGDVDLQNTLPLLVDGPSLDDGSQRCRVEAVKLVPSLPSRGDQPASSRTSRCCGMACRDEPNPCFIFRSRSSSRMARWVGSARALNTSATR